MSILETRRSVRRFTGEPVSRELVAGIVDRAAYAPSWKNSQTVRYVAVDDAAVKEKIAADCVMGFVGNAANIRSCAVLVVLATVTGRCGYERDGSPTTSKGDRWESFDAGIAAQTFCLAAHEAGLGTVIMGIFDDAAVAQAVGLPEGQVAAALIALGHPAEEPKAPRRKTAEELLSWR